MATGLLVVSAGSTVEGQSFKASVPAPLTAGINNTAPDGETDELSLSPNSGISVFKSYANNLVDGDTNEMADIFVRSAAGVITRVSVSSNNDQGDAASRAAAISQVTSKGTYGVAFISRASTLVPGLTQDETNYDQIYLRVPNAKKTFLVSRAFAGGPYTAGIGNSGSPSVVALDDGAKFLVAFHSNAENIVPGAVPGSPPGGQNLKRIFFALIDVETGAAKMGAFSGINGGQADGDLMDPVLSGTADQILMRTNATNLGWANAGSGIYQVALLKKDKTVSLISKSPVDGSPGASSSDSHWMSFNSQVFVFKTQSANILDGTSTSPSMVAYSVATGKYTLINSNAAGQRGNAYSNEILRVDPRGRLVAFVDRSSNYLPAGVDTNDRDDVFVKDLQTNEIVRVNLGPGGAQETDGYRGGACLGSLGFTSQVATVGFHSDGSALRQNGTTTGREVYRSLLTFPPPPLDTTTTLEAPPDVVPGVLTLTLSFQKFTAASSGASASNVTSAATKVTYQALVTKKSNGQKLKVISTRNRVTLRNMKPGTYTVRYRVVGTTAKGKKVTTKYSPSTTAKVKSA